MTNAISGQSFHQAILIPEMVGKLLSASCSGNVQFMSHALNVSLAADHLCQVSKSVHTHKSKRLKKLPLIPVYSDKIPL